MALSSSRRQSDPSHGTSSNALVRAFSTFKVTRKDDRPPEEIRGQLGLNLLLDSAEPLADIIFVHGLGGGSRKTWEKDGDPKLFWPKEWLSREPEFRRSRVHSFGYQADWIDRKASDLNISDFSTSLLNALQTSPLIRRSKHTRLLFVCHSMGGLVAKRAFTQAQVDPAFEELGRRMYAIFFLATPHQGAGSAELLNRILKASQSGPKPFVADLERDSPVIKIINDEFRHNAHKLRLHSFYETDPTSISGLHDTFIVPRANAIMSLQGERIIPLKGNHRGVCKYSSPMDPNYQLVRDALIERLEQLVVTWTVENEEKNRAQKRALRSFLGLHEELGDTHVDFEEPRVQGSCEWLTEVEHFRQWRDTQSPRIFWLNGNAGIGKSFIARYAIDHLREMGFDCSYFFFRAGDDQRRSSLAGCLFSLASQMAEENVFIRDAFLELQETDSQFNKENLQSLWRTLFVGGIFKARISKPHFWVLDGLDECADASQFFQLVAKIPAACLLPIFVTSRQDLLLEKTLRATSLKASLVAVQRADTMADIRLYVEQSADFPQFQDSRERHNLVQVILNKSQGSFLWVRLVLKELRCALSPEAVRQVLASVPRGMDQIYLRSLRQLTEQSPRQSVAKAILMWASAHTRPLTISELKGALLIHVKQTLNNLEHDISWLCGHLVIVDSGAEVRMAHETARGFVLNPDNGSAVAFGEREAHERLAQVCLEYLTDKELRSTRGNRRHTVATTAAPSPFFKYAAVAFHEHLWRSKSGDENLLELLYNFCNSGSGNILTWIEHIAATSRELSVVARAGTLIQSFAKNASRNPLCTPEKIATVEAWGMDLVRLVAKFGRNILLLPGCIHTMVPVFCPRSSALYRTYGRSQRGIKVLGVPSLLEWDDCLATIMFRQRTSRARCVATTTSTFASGMSNGHVRLYHASTCQEMGSLPHGEAVRVVDFDVTGQLIAVAGKELLSLWDVSTRKMVWEHELEASAVTMSFSNNDDGEEETIVVACQDNHLRYFSVLEGKQIEDPIEWFLDEEHEKPLSRVPAAAALSCDLSLLAVSYRGSHIGLWDWQADKFVGLCEEPNARRKACPFHATSLVFSPAPGADSLAASYEQGEILVFDPLDGSIKASYKSNTDDQTLACSPDGRTLISGDSEGTIRIFDFQLSDRADGEDGKPPKLKLLYIISGQQDPVSALAFCNNIRIIDIRGSSIKVWEPTILSRQAGGPTSDAESITSEPTENPSPEVTEPDTITSLTLHPGGKHIFCATEKGLIKVFDTGTGQQTQSIQDQSDGDTINWMIFFRGRDILATAGISTNVVIRKLAYTRQQWHIQSTLFEHRMGERIEQLFFDPTGTRILVVTTTRDMAYNLTTGATHEVRWDTRLPGVWCNDPRDKTRLILTVNERMRVFSWDGLREITGPSSSVALDFDRPQGFGIMSVHSGWRDQFIATVYAETGRARSRIRLLFWDASHFPAQGPAPDDDEDGGEEVTPHPALQLYGNRVERLVGAFGAIIGISANRVLFLDRDGWVCSIILDDAPPETYNCHFPLPLDWLSTNEALLLALTTKGDIVFGKGDEIAVIRHGLDSPQIIPLPVRSRRSSSGT